MTCLPWGLAHKHPQEVMKEKKNGGADHDGDDADHDKASALVKRAARVTSLNSQHDSLHRLIPHFPDEETEVQRREMNPLGYTACR